MNRHAATIPLEAACTLLGCSRQFAYQAIREDRFPLPTLNIGRRIVVSRNAVRRVLELDDAELDARLASVGPRSRGAKS